MWIKLASLILRNRLIILAMLGILTLLAAFVGQNVRLQYGLPNLLPDDDTTLIINQRFRENFGPESVVFAFGIGKDPLKDTALFNGWYQLVQELRTIDGVDTIVAVTNIYSLQKNAELKKFELVPVVSGKVKSPAELDTLRAKIQSLPFYEGYLFNTQTDASIMGISIDKEVFNSTERARLVTEVMAKAKLFEEEHSLRIHYSGLPIIRTVMTEMTKSELKKFVLLALLVTLILLYLFFRSMLPILVSIVVVSLGVVWSLATLATFNYEITILTGIIPPLLIVIGIPNCIFLINSYHSEFKKHGNKAKSLVRVVHKIGRATFMTNATTAVGFATFVFTQSQVLVEFGIVASINIMLLFVFSILIIPIFFSYMPEPTTKNLAHLERKWLDSTLSKFEYLVLNKRRWVYLFTLFVVITASIGISKMTITGNIAGDLPRNHFIVEDLHFFQEHFRGIIPFEVSIDTKTPKGAVKTSTLLKIDQLQDSMRLYPEISKPVSIVEGIKFTKQAYYGGRPEKYDLINAREKVFFKPYVDNAEGDKAFLKTFLDSSERFARINVQVADLGTPQMDSLIGKLNQDISSIFPKEDYEVTLTGSSVVFLAGTKYMVQNLFISLLIAIFIVGGIMATLFRSFQMVLISITVNLIPLLITAGTMGYFGIPLKPSTILVFSIAFGISVDDTIHFLAKFRQEAKVNNWDIRMSTIKALKETGLSMAYTSIILFFGFSVFDSSQFGGTQALGILVSLTLLSAMLSNLILLPTFLIQYGKSIDKKVFAEPLLDIYDEEEDIDLDNLQLNQD